MKRVKVKLKCPNPLFEGWLQEWKDQAAAKNSELQHCFGKALASLRKYPLRLESGKDCIVLQNFGEKLCVMLDKKLVEYKKTNALPIISVEKDKYVTNDSSSSEVQPKKPRKSEKTKDDEEAKKISKSSPNKEPYVPAWRSGGYAILVTLYDKTKDPDYVGFMKKADLQAAAQPLCDKSLRKPDPGSRYSAWSSMSTLITKGLVTKKSSPAQYSLTDQGMAVAMQLSDLNENDPPLLNSPQSTKPSHNSSPDSGTSRKPATKVKVRKKRPVHSLSPEPDEFKTDDAVLGIPEPYNNSLNSSIAEPSHSNAASSKTKPIESKCDPPLSLSPEKGDIIDLDLRSNSPILPLFTDNTTAIKDYEKRSGRNILQAVAKPKISRQKKNGSQSSNSEKDTQECSKSVASSNDSTVVFPPHTFDIILLVDTQETAGGKTRPQDDATIAELTQTKVLFEVRHLKIGDFAWIARCRSTRHELVLPYIVERKRMDDLGGSIKDGRFHEQKFRLKQSGIQNLIYMVESHGNNQHTGLPLATLYQAAVSTSVQDDFTVKYTNSHRDSMLYLASLTTMLTQIYKNKNLVSCKKEDIVPTNVVNDLIPVMDFNEFNKAASKMKNFNVRELFVRQLVQLKGLSVEKALAIVEKYPTPKLLVQEYQNSGSHGEKLLASLQYGPMKRQLGPALSKSIHQFYTRRDLN